MKNPLIYPYLVRGCDCTDYEPRPGWYVADHNQETTQIHGPFDTVDDSLDAINRLAENETEAAV